MLKRTVSYISTGLAIGFIATTACLWMSGVNALSGNVVMRHYTVWLFASALYGFVSLIFDTKIVYPVTLIIHFFSCALITFIACFAAGVFSVIKLHEWFICVLPMFVIIYIIISVTMAAAERIEARKINKKMNNKS